MTRNRAFSLWLAGVVFGGLLLSSQPSFAQEAESPDVDEGASDTPADGAEQPAAEPEAEAAPEAVAEPVPEPEAAPEPEAEPEA